MTPKNQGWTEITCWKIGDLVETVEWNEITLPAQVSPFAHATTKNWLQPKGNYYIQLQEM